MTTIDTNVIGANFNTGKSNGVDNRSIIEVNKIIRSHPVEKIGAVLRQAMTDMKVIETGTLTKVKNKKVEELELA